MKVAALDLGTNSFLCLIAEMKKDAATNDFYVSEIISDEVEIVRLGQDVNKTKMFHPEAITRARNCLNRFKQTIDLNKPERILAMATSAARDVGNAELLFEIGKDLNIPIEIIPGEKEAQISFQGATSGFPPDGKIRVVIDVGGGSTEIIAGRDGKIVAGDSLNIGAVRHTEMFFKSQPPSISELVSLKTDVSEKLKSLIRELKQLKPVEIVAVAGTPTELAAATMGGFDKNKIDQFTFSQEDLEKWVDDLKVRTPEQRSFDFKISKGRSDVILAGTVILAEALRQFGTSRMMVSTRGVRFGVAIELASRSK